MAALQGVFEATGAMHLVLRCSSMRRDAPALVGAKLSLARHFGVQDAETLKVPSFWRAYLILNRENGGVRTSISWSICT